MEMGVVLKIPGVSTPKGRSIVEIVLMDFLGIKQSGATIVPVCVQMVPSATIILNVLGFLDSTIMFAE